MKKRLRKKLRRGEFTEYGFGLALDFFPGLTQEGLETLMDRVITVVEARSMYVGGGGSLNGFGGYVTRRKASCTEEDRVYVSETLRGIPGIAKCIVEDLTSAW
jgi:hypothetical protein